MATIQDTDLLYVQRGDTPHNWTGQELLAQVTASASDGKLSVGQYLTPFGQTYDGSADLTINLDGVPEATPLKAVVRDADGSFATNKLTAATVEVTNIEVTGNITGDAQFSGNLEIDGYIQADGQIGSGNTADGPYAIIKPVGELELSTDSANAFILRNQTSTNPVVTMDASGNVSTVANVQVGPLGDANITLDPTGFYTSKTASGHVNLNVTSGALLVSPDGNQVNAVCVINHDGSIDIGGGTAAADGVGTELSEGSIVLRNDSQTAEAGIRLLKGGSSPTNNTVWLVENDGTQNVGGYSTDGTETQGVYLEPTGKLHVQRPAVNSSLLFRCREGTTDTFVVGAGGQATATGSLTVGDPFGTAEKGVYLYNDGSVTIQHTTRGAQSCLSVVNAAGDSDVTVFEVDGSGNTDAKGEITAPYANFNFKGGRTGKIVGIYEGTGTDDGASPKISLNNDGTITAAGNIAVGYGLSTDVNTGTTLSANGQLYVSTRDDGTAIQVVSADGNGNTVLVSGNGNAQFGGFNQGSNDGNGVAVSSNGQITVQRASTTDSYIYRGFKGTDETYYVMSDGEAYFKADVQVGGNLGVTGNTTMTGTLNVTGTITGNITGNLTGKADDSALLNGAVDSTTSSPDTIAKRDSSGDLYARYFYGSYCNMSHAAAARNSDTVFYSSTDDFIRKNTAAGYRSSLNVPTRTGGDASGSWAISVTGSSASCTGNAASASTVTVNDSNGDASYRVLWHSGNTVYSTGGIYLNPSTDWMYATSFQASSWFRSTGDTGWYSQTHGGGINMQDTTWVRVYGSKAFYVANQIAATSNVTAYYSDERLKEKLGDIEDAVEKVCSIETMYYKHNDVAKEMGYKGDEQQIGVTAQSVKEVAPEVISLAPIDMHTEEDGTVVSKTGEDYMTVDYGKLVPLLIESIKEQQDQINKLEKRIKDLES